jgi:hypothetical protein
MIRGLHGLCVTIAHCKGNVDANFLSLNDAIFFFFNNLTLNVFHAEMEGLKKWPVWLRF